MLARLWWKELRALGPSWPLLWLAAAGVQMLLLYAGDDESQTPKGVLTPIALIWAVLYAFAAGAAAFAGERESRSMGFLDALPVGRGTLWLGKATFALVTTFGLALALVLLGAVGTTGIRDPLGEFGYDRLIREFGILLFEAVAWSLLWSSILGNPLAAGAMGVGSVGLVLFVSNIVFERGFTNTTDLVAYEALTARLILVGGALAASALILIRPRLPRRAVVARVDPAQATIVPSRASAGRSLDWQARREGQGTWLLILAVGVVAAIAGGFRGFEGPDVLNAVLLGVLACLAAGVSVFGPEGSSGTRRFLLHQGVSAGQAWGRKLWVWGLAMAAFGGFFFLVLSLDVDPNSGRRPMRANQPELVFASVLLDAFAVGLLAGMAIPRRITAMLMATIALLAIAPLQVGLQQQGMIPAWTLLVTPAVLLVISRAWAGDWLADRGGARPAVRLGLMLAVPALVASGGYIGYRAFGVADAAPAPEVPKPVGEDLTGRYRRIIAEIEPSTAGGISDEAVFRVVRDEHAPTRLGDPQGPDPARAGVLAWRDMNGPTLDRIRQASAVSRGYFDVSGDGLIASGVEKLSSLLSLEARDRLARGELAGSWEDIIALFRIAEQAEGGPPSIYQSIRASTLSRSAFDLAIDWANDHRQEPATIRKARDDLNRLAAPPSAVAAFRAESRNMDRLLGLPGDEIGRMFIPAKTSLLHRVGFNLLVASPWERRRAQQVIRAFLAEEADRASAAPWQRPPRPGPLVTWQKATGSSPLAWRMMTNTEGVQTLADRQVEARGALEQVLAIRSWQLSHDGKPPATLEELVPSELPRLPIDPYSGRSYGYILATGQALPKHRSEDPSRDQDYEKTRVGQPLLYSVGPDGSDGRAMGGYLRRTGLGDLVYPIP